MATPIRLAPNARVSRCSRPNSARVSGRANSSPPASGSNSAASVRGERNTTSRITISPAKAPRPMVGDLVASLAGAGGGVEDQPRVQQLGLRMGALERRQLLAERLLGRQRIGAARQLADQQGAACAGLVAHRQQALPGLDAPAVVLSVQPAREQAERIAHRLRRAERREQPLEGRLDQRGAAVGIDRRLERRGQQPIAIGAERLARVGVGEIDVPPVEAGEVGKFIQAFGERGGGLGQIVGGEQQHEAVLEGLAELRGGPLDQRRLAILGQQRGEPGVAGQPVTQLPGQQQRAAGEDCRPKPCQGARGSQAAGREESQVAGR